MSLGRIFPKVITLRISILSGNLVKTLFRPLFMLMSIPYDFLVGLTYVFLTHPLRKDETKY